MKLIDDFSKKAFASKNNWNNLCPEPELPNRLSEWWVLEDGDLECIPETSGISSIYTNWEDYLYFVKEVKQKYGFNRAKNTKAQLEKQKEILSRFPLDGIHKIAHLYDTLNRAKVYQGMLLEYFDTIKIGDIHAGASSQLPTSDEVIQALVKEGKYE